MATNYTAMSQEQLLARIAELEAHKGKPAKEGDVRTTSGLTLRVGEKGGVSIYGVGRFPVTLYAGQLDKVIADIVEIKAFRVANDAKLAKKDKN